MYRIAAVLLVIVVTVVVFATSSTHAFPGRNGAIAFGWHAVDEPELGPPFTYVRAIRTVHPPGTKARTVIGCRESDTGPLAGNCSLPAYADPAFSPSGKLIAFDAGPTLAIREAGGALTVLPAHSEDDGEPAFSPTGPSLVFSAGASASQPGAVRDLWISDRAGAGAHRLIRNGSDPAWSTRNWIAFVRDGAIWRVRPDGGKLRKVASRASAPAWSPHGTKLAFVRRGRIVVARADGSAPRRVLQAGAVDLAWSPDGRQLAFDVFDGGVWTTFVKAGEARQLVPGGVNATSSFGADGVDWQPRR